MKLPAFQFYPGDWLKDPAITLCSSASRGVWIDLLCVMHESGRSGELRGTTDQLARLARTSTADLIQALTDFQTTGAADVTERNGIFTVTSRRLKREAKEREMTRSRVERFRRKDDVTARVTPLKHLPSSSSSSSKYLKPPTPFKKSAVDPEVGSPDKIGGLGSGSVESESNSNRKKIGAFDREKLEDIKRETGKEFDQACAWAKANARTNWIGFLWASIQHGGKSWRDRDSAVQATPGKSYLRVPPADPPLPDPSGDMTMAEYRAEVERHPLYSAYFWNQKLHAMELGIVPLPAGVYLDEAQIILDGSREAIA